MELTTAVESHAACAGPFVLLEAALIDELLGSDVTGREEDGGGDALGEQRASREPCLIPGDEAFSDAKLGDIKKFCWRSSPAEHCEYLLSEGWREAEAE